MKENRTISMAFRNAMAHKQATLKCACFLTFTLLVWIGLSYPTPADAQVVPPTQCANPAGPAPVLNTTGVIGLVDGSEPVLPAAGQGGFQDLSSTPKFFPNFKPYRCPGQDEDKSGTKLPDSEPFAKSYAASNTLPVQSSDWWTVFGLQKSTTVTSRGDNLSRTRRVVSEPMTFEFVDFNRPDLFPGLSSPAGLRIWSQNGISVRCDGKQADVPTPCNQQPTTPSDYNPKNVSAGTGNITEDQPVVTVGLKGVHPLGLTAPSMAPWTNVVVKRYTDWGVVLSYANSGSEMRINAANGSPFAWFTRTLGAAPFEVWVGGTFGGAGGIANVWLNAGGVIGLTIRTEYIPFKGLPPADSTASYLIYANKGTWTATTGTGVKMSQIQYENTLASLVVVMAVPHNLTTTAELLAAKGTFLPFACRAIYYTFFDYPPNNPAMTLVPLGYDPTGATVTAQLRAQTGFFGLPGCTDNPNAPALLLLYPHHRKSTIASQKTQEMPQFSWNSLLGKLTAFNGSVLVQQLRTLGVLPFLPSAALNSNMQNPLNVSELASDDIYATAKTWFYREEPIPCPNGPPCPHLNSFVRNLALYDNVGTNSYIPGTTSLREGLVLADQFSQSKKPDR